MGVPLRWRLVLAVVFICVCAHIAASTLRLPCTSSTSRCGRPAIEPSSRRIIGGQETVRGSWPWMVILVEEGFASCGGAIISDRFVLTATHCFIGKSSDPNRWIVYAAKHRLDRIDPEQKSIKVKKIITHDGYSNNTLVHDIALVQLETPLPMSTFIQPICLPSADQGVTIGELCMLAGWGQTRGTADQMALNQVPLPIISDDTCAQPDWYGHDFSPETTFCAGYEEGGKDACTGDSGGPLICKRNSSWYVQGISSWGYGCAEYKWPGIYTEVSKYADWIIDKVLANSDCGTVDG